MTVFADSSALVKLYADEVGAAQVRAIELFAVSALARVEVPAALWRKVRTGALAPAHAEQLVAAFEGDWYADPVTDRRLYAVPAAGEVLAAAARAAGVHGLRAYDAVQLASAAALREAGVVVDAVACFDHDLRAAAAAEGFALLPVV